jgi:hypothetical protein
VLPELEPPELLPDDDEPMPDDPEEDPDVPPDEVLPLEPLLDPVHTLPS